MKSPIRDLIRGAIDIHVHCDPDGHRPRRADGFELAEAATKLGMGGFVVKDHGGSSVGVAMSVKREYPDLEVFGGVVLNTAVGGLNPEAAETAARAGGKFIWMPTLSARTDVEHKGGEGGISLLDDAGALRSEVRDIIDVAAEHGAVLATGHVGTAECVALVEAAAGRAEVVITHANILTRYCGMNGDDVKKLAAAGAWIELSLIPHMPAIWGLEPAVLAELLEAGGLERCIVSTDFGWHYNAIATEGMWMAIGLLMKLGVKSDGIVKLVRDNPRQMLGL